jgi:hypothetical protein
VSPQLVRYLFFWSQLAEFLMLEDKKDFLTTYWPTLWPRLVHYLTTHSTPDHRTLLLHDHLRLLYSTSSSYPLRALQRHLDTLAKDLSQDPLYVRTYLHLVHAKLSNVERWVNFNSVFKNRGDVAAWSRWLEGEAARTRGQVNW